MSGPGEAGGSWLHGRVTPGDAANETSWASSAEPDSAAQGISSTSLMCAQDRAPCSTTLGA